MESPIAARSISRIAALSAYSGSLAKLFDGPPVLVLPPAAAYRRVPEASSASPLTVWFSAERDSPRTRSVRAQPSPTRSSREITPEFVSRPVSTCDGPPPMRGSLEAT